MKTMIYAFHHNPIDPYIGAGVRTINVLKIMGKLFGSQITLYTIKDDGSESLLDGIVQKYIHRPFPFTKIKGGYLCMFPFTIARQLREKLDRLEESSTIIFESPFMGYAVSKSIGFPANSLKIYDAHNVEAQYWQPYLQGPLKRRLLKKVRKVEQHVADISDYIFVTSNEEGKIFENEYSVDKEKLVLVPNGVDTTSIRPLNAEQKNAYREKLGLAYSKYVVFVGSRVKANIDAATWIIDKLAPSMPDTCFIIIGSVCSNLLGRNDNVKCMGVLTTEQKNFLMAASDIAINPVTSGAGTNVKMLEYLAVGLPVVTTDIGARGLSFNNGVDGMIAKDLNDFPELISAIYSDPTLGEKLSRSARAKAEDFDWRKIELAIREKFKDTLENY